MSEVLKLNTTLTTLDLGRSQQQQSKVQQEFDGKPHATQ